MPSSSSVEVEVEVEFKVGVGFGVEVGVEVGFEDFSCCLFLHGWVGGRKIGE